MATFQLSQINVFSTNLFAGNPVAVIHNAESLNEVEMSAIARWTNLSETTFLLPPSLSEADYRVRIFSPGGELPFAGHPTLGSCRAWLAAGGKSKNKGSVVQQCEVGLIAIRQSNTLLEFAAPPLIRTGPLDGKTLNKISKALGLVSSDIIQHQWVDNGPGWCAVLLKSAQQVLDIKPDMSALKPFNLGVLGPYDSNCEASLEVRAFVGKGGYEDPVTGSLNASLAQWLIGAGLQKSPYVAAQGTVLQREGRVHLRESDGEIWVGGHAVAVIRGEIRV